jgi:hypothetical protein
MDYTNEVSQSAGLEFLALGTFGKIGAEVAKAVDSTGPGNSSVVLAMRVHGPGGYTERAGV